MNERRDGGKRSTKPREPGCLTVIVPNYNRREMLARCLESLRRQTADCRVLVVDDGSTDGSAQMVADHFPDFSCLRCERNRGFAKAVNLGLGHCRTEFAALLNNDTEADPRWVEAGLEGFRSHPDYWSFACKIVNHRRRDRLDGAGDIYGRDGLALKRGNGRPPAEYSVNGPVLGASAGAAFYRMALFDEIGTFDESYYMYLEDVDFSLRAQLAGRKCLFLHRALVYHVEAASDPLREGPGSGELAFYSPNRVYWITRNRWQLMWTYQPFRNAPWLIYGWTKSALFHLLKAGYSLHFLRGSLAATACLPQAWRKRRHLRRAMRITEAELCRLLRTY